jgi:hypothetical protein
MAIAAYKHCPACERPRGDLGMGQACPTCGCPPTDELTIIHQQRPAAGALLIAGAILFLLAVPGKEFGRWTPAALFLLGVMLLVSAALTVRRRNRAVLWPAGFTLITWQDPPLTATWNEFSGITFDESRARIVLSRRDGGVSEIPIQSFGTARRAATFADFATQHLHDALR